MSTPTPLTLDEAKAAALGEWTSLSIELRPTEDRTGSGVVEPTRLTRRFVYETDGTFTGVITMFGDDYGQVPMLAFEFRGHTVWGGPHPIAAGAFEIDYVLDLGFAVTPLLSDTAAMLNAALPAGMAPFEHGVKTDILGKEFPLFSIVRARRSSTTTSSGSATACCSWEPSTSTAHHSIAQSAAPTSFRSRSRASGDLAMRDRQRAHDA